MALAHICRVRMAVKSKGRGVFATKAGKARRTGTGRQRNGHRIELGDHVVADPLICHGKLTYKGTRIMVWQILEALAQGESVDALVQAWGGRVSKAAVLETIRLASSSLLDGNGRLNPQSNGHLVA